MREDGKDPIIVDAGDFLFSTKNINDTNRKSEIHRAKSILEGFNKIGCDAINVGQYEILNGLKFLKEISEDSNIPFISANIRDRKTSELIFSPYYIVKKNQLKFGIIGVTDLLPDTCKTLMSDSFIDAGNNYVKELSNKTDFLIMLVNADRDSQKDIASKFPGVDFIITSGSTNMSRPNSPQKEKGPFMYSCGKQGKHLLVLEGNVTDSKHPLIDISSHQKKIMDINKRFNRLQKKDPEKSLEKIPPFLILISMLSVMYFPISLATTSTIAIVILSSALIASLKRPTVTFQIFTHPKIVYIGLISYSLYLWHWGVLSISRWTIGIHWWSVPIQVALMFGLAAASFHWIETPLRNSKWLGERWINLLAGGGTLVVLSGGLITLIKPFEGKLFTGSEFNKWNMNIHREIKVHSSPTANTIYLLGDSHAGHYAAVMDHAAKQNNHNLIYPQQKELGLKNNAEPQEYILAPIDKYSKQFKQGDIIIFSSI